MSQVNRVVVGVDGTPNSLQALREAVQLAREHVAHLVAVLAWEPPGGEQQARYRPVPALAVEWQHTAERKLTTAFEEGLGGLPADLHCEPLVVRGPTGRVLVGVADREGDLLVVGAGRRGRISHLVHSHIARYCVAHAKCRVVTVPPPPLADLPPRLSHLVI